MSWTDPKFRYTKAEDMKPGYLAEKFKKIRAEQKKAAEAKVQQFPQRRKA